MNDNLVCALQVLTADYLPIEKFVDEIVETKTPLDILMDKEALSYERRKRISRKFGDVDNEVKELIEIIVDLPPNAFFDNGVVKKGFLYKECKSRKKWSSKKVEILKGELKFFLKGLSV